MRTSELLAAAQAGSPIDADLAEIDLFVLHWDERDGAVTVGFDGTLDESGRLTLGAAADHDRLVFHLRFPQVSEFDIEGWSYEPTTRFTCIPSDDRMSVVIAGPKSSIRFTSDTIAVIDHRTLHAAPM
jgi:hypothetical protein